VPEEGPVTLVRSPRMIHLSKSLLAESLLFALDTKEVHTIEKIIASFVVKRIQVVRKFGHDIGVS
jgi:hypothetical protein